MTITYDAVEVEVLPDSLADQGAILARAALRASGGRRPWSGQIDCPLCADGVVTLVILRDGRIVGRCDTADCVSFSM